MMDFHGFTAALRGMFMLRPNNPSHKAMLRNLDELNAVTRSIGTPRPETELEGVMRRIVKAAGE